VDRAGRPPRFFVPDLTGPQASLPAGECHHALNVLRLRAGDAVELFDGRGRSAEGRVVQVGRDGVVVDVERVRPPARRAGPRIHLAFAVPKGKRLDWLLEKAAELGAASLTPVVFHRSVAGGEEMGEAKRRRWEGHCVAAAKQSGLAFLPELREPVALDGLLASSPTGLRLLGDADDKAAPVARAVAGRRGDQPIILLVGPEGGLTDDERLAAAAAGFQPVRLGGTILRIETAAVALLAAAVACSE